jgi:predicted secreted protein
MSAPSRINGTDLVISIAGTNISHTTNASISIEVASIDISSKDDAGVQEVIAGQTTASVDFEGMVDFSAAYGVDSLMSALIAKTEVAWLLGTGAAGDRFEGTGIITTLSVDAPMEDASTFSGTITVSGGVTFTAS